MGHALHDAAPTIVHHFDATTTAYPLLECGALLSGPLLRRLGRSDAATPPPPDFAIDAQHELAVYLRRAQPAVHLTHSPAFCLTADPVWSPACSEPNLTQPTFNQPNLT